MSNSYFDFIWVDTLLDDINRKDCFDTQEMNGTDKNFKIVLASSCPDDIEDCLDDFGTLNDSVEILQSFGENDGEIALLWGKGINGERTMSIADTSVYYELDDGINYLKGAFLVSYANGSGYVIAYSIKNATLEIQEEQLILPLTGIVWNAYYRGKGQ